MDNEIAKETNRIEKLNNLDKYKTALTKVQFINEIKNGLGEEIKNNPNTVIKINKTWYQKFKIIINNIFTKF